MRVPSFSSATAAVFLLAMTGLGAGYAADAARPAPQADAVATATQDTGDTAIVKTVDEACQAMREIRAARLAIFNGDTEQAQSRVSDARKELETAQSAVPTHAIKDKKTLDGGDSYLPFDTSLSLADANEHHAKGEFKHAAEVLKPANTDITVSAALLPINISLTHVNDAAALIEQQKYYGANLALKAVEDSVVLNSYTSDEVPAQG